MRIFHIISTFTLILLASLSSRAQNYMMPQGQSGFHGSVILVTGNFANEVAFTPGYTWNGIITGMIDIGKSKDNLNNFTSTVVRPSLGIMLLKQKETGLPLSLNLETGLRYNILPATSVNSQAWQIGGQLFHKLSIDTQVAIIPRIGLIGSRDIEKNGVSDDDDFDFTYNIGTTILWDKVYFEPQFLLGGANRGFLLKIGYVFTESQS